jgi:hypothetical protein
MQNCSLDIITWFCYIKQITTGLYTLFHGEDSAAFDAILTGLDLFEKELASRATQFFGGKDKWSKNILEIHGDIYLKIPCVGNLQLQSHGKLG